MQKNKLEDCPFSYRVTKSGEVHISHHCRVVTIIRGEAAQKLHAKLVGSDDYAQQLLLAKATGHYKH